MKVKISIVLKSFETPKLAQQTKGPKEAVRQVPQETKGSPERSVGTQWGKQSGRTLEKATASKNCSSNVAKQVRSSLLSPLSALRARTQKPVKVQRNSAKVRDSRFLKVRSKPNVDLESTFEESCARLPLRQSLYTVLRSPHIDKKSREQFEMKVHQQLIRISTETNQLRDKLFHLKFHEMSGVQMKVIFHYKTRLNF